MTQPAHIKEPVQEHQEPELTQTITIAAEDTKKNVSPVYANGFLELLPESVDSSVLEEYARDAYHSRPSGASGSGELSAGQFLLMAPSPNQLTLPYQQPAFQYTSGASSPTLAPQQSTQIPYGYMPVSGGDRTGASEYYQQGMFQSGAQFQYSQFPQYSHDGQYTPPMGLNDKPKKLADQAPKQPRRSKKEYYCPEPDCGRMFKRSEHLKRHSRIHSGIRPFQCPVPECGKMFSRSDNLTQHIRIHKANAEKGVVRGRKPGSGGNGQKKVKAANDEDEFQPPSFVLPKSNTDMFTKEE